jgi:hypothetical protein
MLFKLKGSRSVFKSTHKELVGTRVDTLKSDLALSTAGLVLAVFSDGFLKTPKAVDAAK